jgi:hypothetical protein
MRRVLWWLRIPAALVLIAVAAAEISGQAAAAVVVVIVVVAVLAVAGLCWLIADGGRSGRLAELLDAADGPPELPVPVVELSLPGATAAAPDALTLLPPADLPALPPID